MPVPKINAPVATWAVVGITAFFVQIVIPANKICKTRELNKTLAI